MEYSEEKIKELFATVLQVPQVEITYESTPDTIVQWDSLNHLNLIATFEDELSIDIEPEEMQEMMENFKKFKTVILQKVG